MKIFSRIIWLTGSILLLTVSAYSQSTDNEFQSRTKIELNLEPSEGAESEPDSGSQDG